MRWIALLTLMGCKEDCVEMCQRIDNWLNECGYTWEKTFEKDDWTSIDDCYDEYADATGKQNKTCTQNAKKYNKKECY